MKTNVGEISKDDQQNLNFYWLMQKSPELIIYVNFLEKNSCLALLVIFLYLGHLKILYYSILSSTFFSKKVSCAEENLKKLKILKVTSGKLTGPALNY